MAQITRSSIIQWLTKALGIQAAGDRVPTVLNGNIQAVMEVYPKLTTVVKNSTTTATTTVNMYTTPTNKDFYLTYVYLAVTKDATNDNTEVILQSTFGGIASTRIVSLPFQTTTAATDHIEIAFDHPLLIDRGVNLQLAGAFTAGTMTKACSIGGYILE